MNRFKFTLFGLIMAAALVAICAMAGFVSWKILTDRPESGPDASVLTRIVGAPVASPSLPSLEAVVTPSATVGLAEQVAPAPLPSPSVAFAEILPGSVMHTVQGGENLYRISLAYGVTVAEILAANGLADPSFIAVGQVLRIPVAPTLTPPGELSTAEETSPAATAVELTPTASPSPAPTATPAPLTSVNGLGLETILDMPENVLQSARQIVARGQELGRDPAAFSKVGDSTIENPHFLARFDEGSYNLGDYAYLQSVIDHFVGSFGRQGAAVRRGLHSWTVTDPAWADKSICLPNESPLACEFRLHNPSVILIRLGSNDAGVPGGFEQNMRQVITYSIDNGVLPVIGTKADRFEGSNVNNEILRRLAAEFQVPLWDFDLVAATIPGRGLDVDGVHLTTFYAHDYTSPTAFQRGHGLHNLTALMVLDAIWREVIRESD